MVDYITYSNQNATRNEPLSDQLVNTLAYLKSMGITADVFSGGQEATGPHRTGSHRHDAGNAADVTFYKDGKPLSWENPADIPIFQEIVEKGKAAGLTGFGAGEGYMRPGTMHIGFGTPGVWGAGGAGSAAPKWLVDAYNNTTTPAATETASAAPTGGTTLTSTATPAQAAVPPAAPPTMKDKLVGFAGGLQDLLAKTKAAAAPASDASTISTSNALSDDLGGRMQAAQQLMSTLAAKNRGLSLASNPITPTNWGWG